MKFEHIFEKMVEYGHVSKRMWVFMSMSKMRNDGVKMTYFGACTTTVIIDVLIIITVIFKSGIWKPHRCVPIRGSLAGMVTIRLLDDTGGGALQKIMRTDVQLYLSIFHSSIRSPHSSIPPFMNAAARQLFFVAWYNNTEPLVHRTHSQLYLTIQFFWSLYFKIKV